MFVEIVASPAEVARWLLLSIFAGEELVLYFLWHIFSFFSQSSEFGANASGYLFDRTRNAIPGT